MSIMKNPDAKCSFCERTNEVTKGLLTAPNGTLICQDCADFTCLTFARRDELAEKAKEISAERERDGKYVSGGISCDCVSCWSVRLTYSDPIMRELATRYRETVGQTAGPDKPDEKVPAGATIN